MPTGMIRNIARRLKLKCQLLSRGAFHPHFGQKRSAKTVDLMRVNHSHTKLVFQYAYDQITFIDKYDSIRQAVKLTGISRGYLCRCISEGTLVHGKWFFSYSAPV